MNMTPFYVDHLKTLNGEVLLLPIVLHFHQINCVFVAMALKSLFKFRKDQVKREDKEHSTRQAGIALLKAFVIVLPLLGLTWVIGLLAVNPYTTVFAWIFLFLNSCQGVLIFFFHVVRHDKVWPKLTGLLKRQKYRLTTATVNSNLRRKSTSVTGTSTIKSSQSARLSVEVDSLKRESVDLKDIVLVNAEVVKTFESLSEKEDTMETSAPKEENDSILEDTSL
jgi:hypothetical protein